MRLAASATRQAWPSAIPATRCPFRRPPHRAGISESDLSEGRGAPHLRLDDPQDFFKGDAAHALPTSAEVGSAYTLMNPHDDAVVPELELPRSASPARCGRALQCRGFLDDCVTVEKDSGGRRGASPLLAARPTSSRRLLGPPQRAVTVSPMLEPDGPKRAR